MLDRDVAVKVLNDHEIGQGNHDRLLREARAAAKLKHANIITVHDAGEHEGTPYIVMEFVEGESLFDKPPKNVEDTVSIICQVSLPLDHTPNKYQIPSTFL